MYNFLPLQVVKTGGREKRTVLVTLTFSIFCGQRNFFRTKPHCLYISPFIRKPGVRNSDTCIFTLLKEWKKNVFISVQKARVHSAEIVRKKNCYLCSESKGPKFGPLHFHSSEIVKNMSYRCLASMGLNFKPSLFALLK